MSFANPAVPLAMPATSGEVSGFTGGEYVGFTIRETAGAVAHVTLYDNASAASGSILEDIALAANGSAEVEYPRPGRRVQHGIYAAITGAVEGSVFV